MGSLTIESLLQQRGSWLKGEPSDVNAASARADLTQIIAASYHVFEEVRDGIIRNADLYLRGEALPAPMIGPEGRSLQEELCRFGMAFRSPGGAVICESQGRRYLTGGWLEELAWLAAIKAGADEAVFGQCLGWKVKNFSGENEIDLIMRKGGRLGFVSCKALRSELDIHDRKHRNRLMDAVHEADNLADHFGRHGDAVAVLVTTDLIDESKGAARYNSLMGKAAVLDVRIIPLEELALNKLSAALVDLLADNKGVSQHESHQV